ncbi:MAG: hypothetical protein ACI8V4_003624, partial [Ilumatobacter sp.]
HGDSNVVKSRDTHALTLDRGSQYDIENGVASPTPPMSCQATQQFGSIHGSDEADRHKM